MTIQTELLPYTKEALQPVLSDQTLFYHYEKHYKTYVNTANTLIAGTEMEHLSLVEIIQKAKAEHGKLFNNAAQCYNHVFYFNSLAAETQKPEGKLAEALVRDFGSLKAFEDAMKEAGVSQFGSGWVWLVSDEKGKLSVIKTAGADNPLGEKTPLLTLDVWEHAYYLDYQNRRADYLSEALKKLNWRFAEDNYLTLL